MRSAASGTATEPVGSLHSDTAHREVGDIVSHQHSTMSPGGSRDESVSGVKSPSPTDPFGLITPSPTSGLGVSDQKTQPVSQRLCLSSLSGT